MNKEKESEPINRSRKIPLQLLTTWSTSCGNETRNQRRAIFFPISRFCLTIRFDVDYILYFWSRSYVKQESGGKLVLSVSVPEMDKFSSDDPRSNFLKSFPNRIEKIIRHVSILKGKDLSRFVFLLADKNKRLEKNSPSFLIKIRLSLRNFERILSFFLFFISPR